MEVAEIELVLEKIWDLHDKLSDAIHFISRAHFLNSVKDPTRKSREFHYQRRKKSADDGEYDDPEDKNGHGFVFLKEFQVEEDGPAIQEAKSLYAIRTALENMEDQLEFFHTVQIQQRAERDSAIARLEQSRIILAMRLADHQGKKYKVIEEAQALLGDMRDAGRFASPENFCATMSRYPLGEGSLVPGEKGPNALVNLFLPSINFVSKLLKLDSTIGIVGNAALFALSMLALFHAKQNSCKDKFMLDLEDRWKIRRGSTSTLLELSSLDSSKRLHVMLSRG